MQTSFLFLQLVGGPRDRGLAMAESRCLEKTIGDERYAPHSGILRGVLAPGTDGILIAESLLAPGDLVTVMIVPC
jgi:hypothetical protein